MHINWETHFGAVKRPKPLVPCYRLPSFLSSSQIIVLYFSQMASDRLSSLMQEASVPALRSSIHLPCSKSRVLSTLQRAPTVDLRSVSSIVIQQACSELQSPNSPHLPTNNCCWNTRCYLGLTVSGAILSRQFLQNFCFTRLLLL